MECAGIQAGLSQCDKWLRLYRRRAFCAGSDIQAAFWQNVRVWGACQVSIGSLADGRSFQPVLRKRRTRISPLAMLSPPMPRRAPDGVEPSPIPRAPES